MAAYRCYPVMLLGTNEFEWFYDTDLQPLDLDEVKQMVEKGEQGNKTNALWQAYKVAAEGHDLLYFKNMLLRSGIISHWSISNVNGAAQTSRPPKPGSSKPACNPS